MKKRIRKRQGLVWKLIRKKIVSRMQNKKTSKFWRGDAPRSLERAGHPRELAMPCKLHAEPKNKQVRWHGSGGTWLVCLSPAAVCGDGGVCPPLRSEDPGRVLLFLEEQQFCGWWKGNGKNKRPPGVGGRMVFFVGGSRGAKLKFLMSVWQARQSGQALVEIFEKVGEKHAQNKRKCAREKIPQKKKKQKGREETRNTGNW